MRALRRFFDWLGRTDVLECDDPLASALPPYGARPRAMCTPRIGENYERYQRRAYECLERALSLEVWKVTAEPDYAGEWKTAHDRISRKRDETTATRWVRVVSAPTVEAARADADAKYDAYREAYSAWWRAVQVLGHAMDEESKRG